MHAITNMLVTLKSCDNLRVMMLGYNYQLSSQSVDCPQWVLIVIYDDKWWWLMTIWYEWWQLMAIDENWWWFMTIGDDWWYDFCQAWVLVLVNLQFQSPKLKKDQSWRYNLNPPPPTTITDNFWRVLVLVNLQFQSPKLKKGPELTL